MKIKFLSVLCMTALLFFGCSSNDSSGTTDGGSTATTFFPLKTGNYWTYDVENYDDSNTLLPPTTRDSLYVGNDTIIGGVTYKKMKMLNAATGFFSSTLRNNGVRIDGSKVKATGSFVVDLGLGTPLSFALNDFTIFDQAAVSGAELSSNSGSFQQTVSTYPLNFEYTIRSEADSDMASFTSPNGDAYTNVKKSKIILNLKVTANISGFNITVLPAQNVVVSTQHYVTGKGMVYNFTDLRYQLATLPPGTPTLPIPSNFHQTQKEMLDRFLINP